MYKLDIQERLIVRELIKDPRISDNKIAANTNVPLKTVNRKRKILEQKGYLSYHAYLNTTQEGTGLYKGRAMLIVTLRDGITRKRAIEAFQGSQRGLTFFSKHMMDSYIGEQGGNVCFMALLESHKPEDLIEIYNADIVGELSSFFGSGCVKDVSLMPVTATLRLMKNYLPGRNIHKGKIKTDWPADYLFVDD